MYLAGVSGGTLSGNLVYGAGPYTQFLTETGAGVSGVTGLADGVTDLDNPLTLFLPSDGLVAARPASGSVLDQATWTGAAGQAWQALPTQAFAPALSGPPAGLFSLADAGNGKAAGNANSTAAGAAVDKEAPALSNGAPPADQLWALGLIDGNTNNVLDDLSGYALNVIGGYTSPGTQLCQWYAGAAGNQDWEVVHRPR